VIRGRDGFWRPIGIGTSFQNLGAPDRSLVGVEIFSPTPKF
jgi:hypothetical protein